MREGKETEKRKKQGLDKEMKKNEAVNIEKIKKWG